MPRRAATMIPTLTIKLSMGIRHDMTLISIFQARAYKVRSDYLGISTDSEHDEVEQPHHRKRGRTWEI